MYSCVIIVILELLTHYSTSGGRDRGLRIYKGELDSSGEFSYVVILQQNLGTSMLQTRRFCTGSLIEARWVLTAAHCVDKINKPEEILIKYGDYTRLPNETKYYKKVIKIIVYPYYENIMSKKALNDIALLFVERVPFKTYARLGAFDHKTSFGLPVKYAGFGLMTRNIFPKRDNESFMQMQLTPLQVGGGIIVPCESMFGTFGAAFRKYSALCVTPKCSKREQQARPGDSGGPLVYDGRLIGVASQIVIVVSTSMYTAVTPYIDWIKNTMRLNDNST